MHTQKDMPKFWNPNEKERKGKERKGKEGEAEFAKCKIVLSTFQTYQN